jgi:hypothetical protein
VISLLLSASLGTAAVAGNYISIFDAKIKGI